MACRRDPTTGSEQCQPTSGNYGEAAATVATTSAVYAGVGCTWQGCELPDRCNSVTKRCEPISCKETSECPSGYRCIPGEQWNICR